jgi:hypothetical protein
MRNQAELESMKQHASSVEKGADDARPCVYRAFFDALEGLACAKELHGPASLEVRIAREQVERARTDAAREWRESGVA